MTRIASEIEQERLAEKRAFRDRLNKARAHWGTATTQTQIPQSHRQASIDAVKAFLDSLDPARDWTMKPRGDGEGVASD